MQGTGIVMVSEPTKVLVPGASKGIREVGDLERDGHARARMRRMESNKATRGRMLHKHLRLVVVNGTHGIISAREIHLPGPPRHSKPNNHKSYIANWIHISMKNYTNNNHTPASSLE